MMTKSVSLDQNNTEIDVSLCERFRERMSLYRHISELFQKGERMDSVESHGETHLSKAFISNENNGELSTCSTNVSF